MRCRIGLVHLMLHVIARRGGSQLQGGRIFLAMQLQPFDLLGSLAGAEDEHPCCQRVERTGMSHLHALHLQPL